MKLRKKTMVAIIMCMGLLTGCNNVSKEHILQKHSTDVKTENQETDEKKESSLVKLKNSIDQDILKVFLQNYWDVRLRENFFNICMNLSYYQKNGYSINENMNQGYKKLEKECAVTMSADVSSYFTEEIKKGQLTKECFEDGMILKTDKVKNILTVLNCENIDIDEWLKDRDIICNKGNEFIIGIKEGYDNVNETNSVQILNFIPHEEEKIMDVIFARITDDYRNKFLEMKKAVLVPDENTYGYKIQSVTEEPLFSEEDLKRIGKELGVPEELKVTYELPRVAYYYEGGDLYDAQVSVLYHGEMIAGATIDPISGEQTGNIFIYSGEERKCKL